ncbi:MAG: hypothetical protein HYV90_04205 [Candidatus Woesebacteria bacterium]|nr:MAG: hypothetical protein HYV90_04205 [Candidatus Woesebacteria bacterium]
METSIFDKEENIGFWKNLILVAVFFTITPITLGISVYSLFSFKSGLLSKDAFGINHVSSSQSGVRVYASLPTKLPIVSGEVGLADARPEIIKQYLEYYHSPLVPYANFIVTTADKYSLDFRLITAIAQQESNLCKIIPPGSYNCWGWGITSVGTLGFDSFEEGIETVSRGLRKNYLDKGYITVRDIMSKYTPQSNGSWADGVSQFMSEME